MPIVNADIVVYCATSPAEDDTTATSAAIDVLRRAVFTTGDIASTAAVEAVSSAAGDTSQTLTVRGRTADGQMQSQTVTLNGTTTIQFPTYAFERIESLELSATCAGTITVRITSAGTIISTIPIGERGVRRLFINAASDPAGSKIRYEKVFVKNTHATLALTTAAITQSADPAGVIAHALSASKGVLADGTANRLTAPAGTFNDSSKNVPTGALAAGEYIGVWLEQTLTIGLAGFKNTYTLSITGNST